MRHKSAGVKPNDMMLLLDSYKDVDQRRELGAVANRSGSWGRCIERGVAGGIADCRKHALDQEYAISDNFNFNSYMILVGVTGTNRLGDFDPKKMYNASLKSKIFVKDLVIGILDIVGWSRKMKEFLPIGFLEGYLVLYREQRAQILLMLVGSSVSGVKRIGLRRGGSRWHILAILPLVNAEG